MFCCVKCDALCVLICLICVWQCFSFRCFLRLWVSAIACACVHRVASPSCLSVALSFVAVAAARASFLIFLLFAFVACWSQSTWCFGNAGYAMQKIRSWCALCFEASWVALSLLLSKKLEKNKELGLEWHCNSCVCCCSRVVTLLCLAVREYCFFFRDILFGCEREETHSNSSHFISFFQHRNQLLQMSSSSSTQTTATAILLLLHKPLGQTTSKPSKLLTKTTLRCSLNFHRSVLFKWLMRWWNASVGSERVWWRRKLRSSSCCTQSARKAAQKENFSTRSLLQSFRAVVAVTDSNNHRVQIFGGSDWSFRRAFWFPR